MAKISFRYFKLHQLLHLILFLLAKSWHHLSKLKLQVTTHFYTISSTISVVLLIVNLIIYVLGCQTFHSRIFSLHLVHGYLPTFPYHFFPYSSHPFNQSSNLKTDHYHSLDSYLSKNVWENPLTHSLPPVVHIVACYHGPFTYANYLSVISAFKFFKPSVLYLHVKQEPEFDPDGYFQFLPDLIRDIPIISKVQLRYPHACSGDLEEQKRAFFHIIGSTGGVAINGKTLLAPSASLRSLLEFEIATGILEEMNQLLLVFAHPGVLQTIPSQSHVLSLRQNKRANQMSCQSVNNFSLKKDHPCVFIMEEIFPIQTFRGDEDFVALARWTGYGTSKVLQPEPLDEEVVPNIVHYVWLGKRKLDFFAFLSVMSSLHVLEAEAIYIHGEEPVMGQWWAKVKDNPRVKVINRDFPDTVYGEPLKRFVSHASDFLRADVLLRYGGVYADWDVIFLQKLPSFVRKHNTTACVDWPETGSFPDVFNMGVLVAAPGAPYLRHFLESYRWYLDNDWSYNAIHMPYKVYEKNPLSLNLDRHLQVNMIILYITRQR